MTIEDFIAARLAEHEDEAERARNKAVGPGAGDGLWVVTGMDNAVGVDYDPERELRRVSAFRSAVAYVASITSASEQLVAEAAVLHPIAAIWDDHPDYQEDWKP